MKKFNNLFIKLSKHKNEQLKKVQSWEIRELAISRYLLLGFHGARGVWDR
jgi:hypothetical protein